MVEENQNIQTNNFNKIIALIENARQNVQQKVNEELINLYYKAGEFLSAESALHSYGDAYIDAMSDFITSQYPDLKGFTRRGLYRMRQFYETYKDDQKVSTLLTQLGWSNHLKILSRTKSAEERHFYIIIAIKEHYSARELDRQITAMRYERATISEKSHKNLPIPQEIKKQFLDSYVFDVLNLPSRYSEKTLQKTIVKNLKDFILEIGKDFSFVGEEYRVQVGDSDFLIDLLFYHRELSCLVAFELKITEFKPEYIGKMNFYLEALDREHRKKNENPSVGIILCADKNDEIVAFALSRNLSPLLVAEYTSKLPDKKLLRDKLRELTELAEEGEHDE